ncbi:hypothetical protein [Hymenobacter rubripertinctus]|uniref:Uncharacterized protein n=1 Tax=Hymenobacter rubripertinctus TaxID=2029981 RepID=A0A418QR34_9BACT|nr:hypothetical protein [Hymenobacter rubripertinctus]RIY07490.1 hypothetical protein D0T11_16225 [Hymenobacter rubripertinctus]
MQVYRHRYATGTLDASFTRLPGQDPNGNVHKAAATYGVRLHAGTNQTTRIDTSRYGPASITPFPTTILAINPYARLDRKWVGLGYGLMLGNLGYHRVSFGDEQSDFDLQASLRLGRRETVYALAEYNYLGYGSANPQHRLGLGTGFGGTRWQVLAGAATAKEYEILPTQSRWSGFIEAQGQFSERWQASTFFTLGNPNQQQAGIRLGYRIPRPRK